MANTEMFKRIRDQIKADPKTFDMGSWEFDLKRDYEEYGETYDHEFFDPSIGDYDSAPVEECGTTRCAAGWAIHFAAIDAGLDPMARLIDLVDQVAEKVSLPAGGRINYETVGAKVLDITQDQARELFYSSDERGWEIINKYANGERD